MGYRSSGSIWLPKETQELLPDELKQSLEEDWDKHPDHEDVWTFDSWKWYGEYSDVDMWNRFYNNSSPWNDEEGYPMDMIVIGEDSAIVVEPKWEKFGYSMNIEIY